MTETGGTHAGDQTQHRERTETEAQNAVESEVQQRTAIDEVGGGIQSKTETSGHAGATVPGVWSRHVIESMTGISVGVEVSGEYLGRTEIREEAVVRHGEHGRRPRNATGTHAMGPQLRSRRSGRESGTFEKNGSVVCRGDSS